MAMYTNPYNEIMALANERVRQVENHYRRKIEEMGMYFHQQQSPASCHTTATTGAYNMAIGQNAGAYSPYIGPNAGYSECPAETEKKKKEEGLKKLIAYYYGRRK